MKYTSEQIELAKSQSIVGYFQRKGYKCEKTGKDVRIKGFGGLVVTDDKVYNWFSQNKGGYGALSCLQTVLGMSFKEAMQELVMEGPQEKIAHTNNNSERFVKSKTEFVMPEKDENYKRVYAYLINQRKISGELISEFVKQKKLMQDKNGNAVFIHYDKKGQACGAELQGTLSEHRFKGVASGTTNSYFSFTRGKPDTSYLFESSIDLMSYIQLHPDVNNAEFVSMAGLKPNVAEQLSERGMKIISCVDCDEAGVNFNKKLLDNCIGLQSILNKQNMNFEMLRTNDTNVNYVKAEINESCVYFFQNNKDAEQVKDNQLLDGRSFVAVHSDKYFSINDECAKENVKDFNELLCKTCLQEIKKEGVHQSLKGVMQVANNISKNQHSEETNVRTDIPIL